MEVSRGQDLPGGNALNTCDFMRDSGIRAPLLESAHQIVDLLLSFADLLLLQLLRIDSMADIKSHG